MELKSEDYRVGYDEESQTLTYQGALRLADLEEYAPMWQMLSEIIRQKPTRLVMDLRGLRFLNSSGFNVLSKFVLKVRQEATIEMVVRAAKNVAWQEKSLKNLQRLMPNLQLEFH